MGRTTVTILIAAVAAFGQTTAPSAGPADDLSKTKVQLERAEVLKDWPNVKRYHANN